MEEIFDRKLTIQDIQKINEMKPKFISIRSTKYLDRRILRELDASIKIRIIGEDENKSSKVKEIKQRTLKTEREDTLYSKEELEQVLTIYEEYEEGIHEEWSDLNKALYVYARLVAEYDVASSKYANENSSILKSIYTSNPNSKGFARNFRELMDRINIPCRYVENIEGTHAWNEIKIDGEYYPVDIALDARISHDKGPRKYFGT